MTTVRTSNRDGSKSYIVNVAIGSVITGNDSRDFRASFTLSVSADGTTGTVEIDDGSVYSSRNPSAPLMVLPNGVKNPLALNFDTIVKGTPLEGRNLKAQDMAPAVGKVGFELIPQSDVKETIRAWQDLGAEQTRITAANHGLGPDDGPPPDWRNEGLVPR